MIDMKGQCLLPGLIDSHIHAIDGGELLTKANLMDDVMTIDQIAHYAKTVLQKKEEMSGDVLLINGVNISTWAKLDEIITVFNSGVFANQKVVLGGSDGHTNWANKTMLEKAGINQKFIQSLPPETKQLYGHNALDEPNGFLMEDAYHKIEALIPDDIDYQLSAQKAIQYCNALGITAWLDPKPGNTFHSSSHLLDAYAYLINTGQLNAHVAATLYAEADSNYQSQLTMLRLLQKKYDQRNFKIIGFKIFADGVVEHPTHTAAMSEPYTGTQSKGILMYDPKNFARFVTAADKEGLLVHVHAIGDRAVTETLNGFEVARKTNGNYKLPHTITHLQFVLPKDFDRFQQLNILASYQLLWALGDITTVDIVKPYIAPSLYQWQYPARSLLQAGAVICGASDWPVSTANPFEAICNAETRRGLLGVLDSTQCMPRLAMLYAYTSEAAKALMMEHQIGSIEPGKSADMILVDRDVLTIPAEQVKTTRVLWTMFEGRIVYQAK